MRADRELVLMAVTTKFQCGCPRFQWRAAPKAQELGCASKELRADREVVLAAVRQDGIALGYASDALRADHEVVLAAVTQAGRALEYASSAFRGDRDMVLAAVTQTATWCWPRGVHTLQYASDALRADREVVLAALTQDGMALECASDALRADREVVLAAVKQSLSALELVSKQLCKDREVVLAALKHARHSGAAMRYALSPDLRGDREVVLAAMSHDGLALQHVSEELRADREVVLAAVKTSPSALEFVSKQLCKDREVVLAALKHDSRATCGFVAWSGYVCPMSLSLRYALSPELRGDREVVLAAMRRDGLALQHVSDEMRNDLQVVVAAVRQNGRALRFAGQAALSQYHSVNHGMSRAIPTKAPLNRATFSTAAQLNVAILSNDIKAIRVVAALQRLALAAWAYHSRAAMIEYGRIDVESDVIDLIGSLVPRAATLVVTRTARSQGWIWRAGQLWPSMQWAGLCRPSAELGAAAGGEPEAAAAMDMFADPDCDF